MAEISLTCVPTAWPRSVRRDRPQPVGDQFFQCAYRLSEIDPLFIINIDRAGQSPASPLVCIRCASRHSRSFSRSDFCAVLHPDTDATDSLGPRQSYKSVDLCAHHWKRHMDEPVSCERACWPVVTSLLLLFGKSRTFFSLLVISDPGINSCPVLQSRNLDALASVVNAVDNFGSTSLKRAHASVYAWQFEEFLAMCSVKNECES